MCKKIAIFLSPLITLIISMKLALLGLTLLLSIDLLTGINKTLHQKGTKFRPLKREFWLSIKSHLLRKTWKKSYEYGIGIVVASLLQLLILGGVMIPIMSLKFSLVELSVIVPSLIEAWSIYENVEAISGRNVLKRLFTILPKPLQLIFTSKKDKV